MNIRSLFACAALLAAPLFAKTETLWASGVNAQEGWYDFNKSRNRQDSELCWAITAANLIAWWQDTCPAEDLPAGVPVGEAVWSTYRASFANCGSDPDEGMRWWFSGQYAPLMSEDGAPYAEITNSANGHYYTAMYPQADAFVWGLLSRARGVQVNAQSLTQMLYQGFSKGSAFWIGVDYFRPDGLRYTHSLTVWGVDYECDANKQPRIVAIYMTDSDDGQRYLHRIPVKVVDNKLLFDCPQHPIYAAIGYIEITAITQLKARLKK